MEWVRILPSPATRAGGSANLTAFASIAPVEKHHMRTIVKKMKI